MKNIITVSLFLLVLTGCLEKKEEVQTVEYYKDHKEERTLKIEECENNPGELSDTPNCINAFRAFGSSGDLPQVDETWFRGGF